MRATVSDCMPVSDVCGNSYDCLTICFRPQYRRGNALHREQRHHPVSLTLALPEPVCLRQAKALPLYETAVAQRVSHFGSFSSNSTAEALGGKGGWVTE